MTYVAVVFARGGSKGLPGKNARVLGGKPLIGWAIQSAQQVKRVERVLVSTDSEELGEIARSFGAEVPFLRPAELATDSAPEWLAWRHAARYLMDEVTDLEGILSVPPTAPLRSVEDLERCLDTFGRGVADVVITVSEANRNPFFNMVVVEETGAVHPVIDGPDRPSRRQDAPEVFDMATIAYVFRPSFVLENSGIFDGVVQSVTVPAERAIDIDTPLDFLVAETLMNREAAK